MGRRNSSSAKKQTNPDPDTPESKVRYQVTDMAGEDDDYAVGKNGQVE